MDVCVCGFLWGGHQFWVTRDHQGQLWANWGSPKICVAYNLGANAFSRDPKIVRILSFDFPLLPNC